MMRTLFIAQLHRELVLAWRRRGRFLQPLLFYILVMLLFPLGMDPDVERLASLAPSLLWVTALLAALLAPGMLFASDFEDGCIDVWITGGPSLAWLVLAKLLAYTAIVSLPLIVASPLLGAWFGLSGAALQVLFLSMALGMPVLCLIGALGGALTLSLPRGGILLALIVLPLYIPVLMFGAGAVTAASQGHSVTAALTLLGGLLLLSLSLIPLATATALRAGLE